VASEEQHSQAQPAPQTFPQPLSQLLAGLPVQLPDADPIVSRVSFDSRRVRPGDLYVGLPGTRSHGALFAEAARSAGAVALLSDPAGARLADGQHLPVVVCDDPRYVMAIASARVWGHPARNMTSFGVTGTNGKSTTVLMLASALDAAAHRVGSIGTLGFLVGGEPVQIDHSTITTPEAPDLQAIIATLAARGADVMAMEVSSHALALNRVAGIQFDVAGFTNLGRDHLDFHHTMEAYYQAKAQLFTPGYAKRAVINGDDEAGRRLMRQAAELGLPAVSVGLSDGCDYRVVAWQPHGPGSRFTLAHDGAQLDAFTCLPGEYNVRNAATALAMIDQAGYDMTAALPGLAAAVIPGRMQPVPLDGEAAPHVYVDFAHTPQAIASALSAFSHPGFTGRRVIAVFGAGGDRDPDKREPMGAVGVHGADIVLVTDDNPRSEDPAAIRARVLAGAREAIASAAPGSHDARVEAYDGGDRATAIEQALRLARAGDVVVILGKGHERSQQFADRTIDFDDVAVTQDRWAQISQAPGGPS
jgi:UDP-N-acetylmuramoyl-L-alanyl-D-glutamate--2,6-diaminopimelate ligase